MDAQESAKAHIIAMWKDIVDPATIKFTGYTLQAISMGGSDDPISMGGTSNPIIMGGSDEPAAPMAVAKSKQYVANPGQMPMTPQRAQAPQQSNQIMAYTFRGTFQDKFQFGKIRLGRRTYDFTMNINAEDGNAIGGSHD
jgi:hypothetical protein